MRSYPELLQTLRNLSLASFKGKLARNTYLDSFLGPVAKGQGLNSLQLLYASLSRNRYSGATQGGTLYLGDSENVGNAEVKQSALLGSFAKTPAPPLITYWGSELPVVRSRPHRRPGPHRAGYQRSGDFRSALAEQSGRNRHGKTRSGRF